jgi:pimeloyl-ACP methyl ester carboxylesterase
LEAGLIGLALGWALVEPDISHFARVCAYDRAGYAWSDPNPTEIPPTSQRLVHELHTLLVNASIAGPYILVAHSFGGLNAPLFAYEYPHETAGLVLIDSANEFADARFVEAGRQPLRERVAKGMKFQLRLTQFGVTRWLLRQLTIFTNPALKEISPELRSMFLQQYLDSQNLQVAMQEGTAMLASIKQVASNPDLGNLPLTVLTPASSSAPWMEAQKDLTRLSTQSKHVIVERTGHAIHADRPDVVIEAIREMVQAARHNNRSE